MRSVAGCVIGGAMALAVVACGSHSKPLSPEQVAIKIAAACAAHKTAYLAGVHATAGPDFTQESYKEYGPFHGDALEQIQKIKAQKEQRVQLDALYQAVDWVLVPWDAAQTALDQRDWAAAQTSIDAGKAQLVQLDAAAAALSLPDCASPTWYGSWFDEAQKYHDDQVQATKPTGDFMTDVKAACARFGKDIADAPSGANPLDINLWALTVDQALKLFVRDVSALDVPDDKQDDVSALKTSADEVSKELSKLESAAVQRSADASSLATSVHAAFLNTVSTVGLTC